MVVDWRWWRKPCEEEEVKKEVVIG